MHNRLHNHFRTDQAEAAVKAASPPQSVNSASDAGEQSAMQRASRKLAAHPALAIGAAFAVGLLLGKWVKR